MSDTLTMQAGTPQAQWAAWPVTAFERGRLSYRGVVLIVTLLGIASLAFDVVLHYAVQGVWPAAQMAFGVVGIVAAVYILFALRSLGRMSQRALVQLRPSVMIDDPQYDHFARRLLAADAWVEIGLLVVALLLVVIFLVLPANQLPELASFGLVGGIGSVVVAVFYTVLFWLLLSLVYFGIRSSRALSLLAQQPLTVNVFDPEPLLPFGRLSLALSLTFVGMFLIPLIIMGPPTRQGGGWFVIGLSVLTLLALFVPLWGVHRQIVDAREDVLSRVCGDLMGVQQSLLGAAGQDTEQLQALSKRTEVLLGLRKHILSAPTWPFRDIGSIFRAVLVAVSPLIYFLLNQLMQSYLFPLFGIR